MRSSLALLFLFCATAANAAEVKLLWPLGRSVYQTNEWIDLSVARSNGAALEKNELVLKVSSNEGSELSFHFPAQSVAIGSDKLARRTEHLHLNGWLLRPGKYTVKVTVDGAEAVGEFDLYTHVRKTEYKLVNWGRATGDARLIEGEDNLGFNLMYGHYNKDDDGAFMRAGCDFMACCVMSGGHQMDLRQECDWSDPLVVRGGTQRGAQRAFIDRTRPNVPGVHFYDEPGLTWEKHPETGETTPHGIASQVKAYQLAFGEPAPQYHKVDPNNPASVAKWKHWAKWKLGFMDAAWKDAQFGVSYVRPDYLSVTQSQYGFSAYTDGYYFNVARSLPVVSGHGGYHDYGLGLLNPSMHLEIARARDFDKPCWYLPTWYGNTTSDEFRAEQYLAFQTNIQGLNSPPDIDPFDPASKPAAQGVVESNKLAARLGPIFNHLPVTRPPVAMLFSLSHFLDKQSKDRSVNYSHAEDHGSNLYFTYLAGKLMQQQFLTVVDEDIVDGTLAAHHKAVILTSIDFLAPEVVTALEDFIAGGGLVLQTSDSEVKIKGAINIGMTPKFPDAEKIAALRKEGKHQEAGQLSALRQAIPAAMEMAKALKPHFDKAGIAPVFECDQPGIVATRQAAGDVEYIFAVNATHDPEQGHPNTALKAVEAKIKLPKSPWIGRVYDAVVGGQVTGFGIRDEQAVRFRFGPGQMRVFARTARPINRVVSSAEVSVRDLTRAAPILMDIGANVLDDDGDILRGAIPMEIVLTDPLGVERHRLFRSTDTNGTLRLTIPLAANDPPGAWRIQVTELLSNKTPQLYSLAHVPATRTLGALAGATERAVSFRGESDNVFRFFRTYQDVTIVTGTTAYHAAAAKRLTDALATWNIRAKTVDAASINKPRSLTPEQARTWVGIDFGRAEPGEKNSPLKAGFAIDGPIVLLGNPDDNPLIAFLDKNKFLPYAPDKTNFPGAGRGYYAWQRDAIGPRQESLTLIAYDEAGLSEAVGSVFEAASGIEPLTLFSLPSKNTIAPATKSNAVPAAPLAWTAQLPDRIDGIGASGDMLNARSHDGTLASIDAAGKITRSSVLSQAELDRTAKGETAPNIDLISSAQKRIGALKKVKHAAALGNFTAVSYWGGTLDIYDNAGALKHRNVFGQDITALTTSGEKAVVGLADGRVLAVSVK